MTRLKTDVLELCLIPLAPTPTCPVDYQLWVAHQEDPEKDVHRGTKLQLATGCRCLLAPVSTHLLFAEVYACGTTCTVEAGGPAPYWSILTAFDYLAKFVKYGYMTVGVHIGVPVTKVVIYSNLWLSCCLECCLHISCVCVANAGRCTSRTSL